MTASLRLRIAALSLCILALTTARAQQTPRQSLLVLSKHDHTLSFVDPATLQVEARAPVGEDPHEVIASADGKTAYVSIYGGGMFHKLSVIDLVTQKALPDIELGPLNGPHGLTFVGGKLWFTAEGAKVIGSYDPATAKVDWVMGTGQDRTHMIYVTPDMKHIYTTNVSSATLSILEMTMRSMMPPPPLGGPGGPGGPGGQGGGPPPGGAAPRPNWEQTLIPVGKGGEGFDVSPDGRELWTGNAQDGTVSVIDLAARKVAATLTPDAQGVNRLKFTLDGKLALLAGSHDGALVVIDTATHAVVKRLPLPSQAAGIQMEPGGARAFVSCGRANKVAVIDLKTLTVVGQIDAGGEPDGLAWAIQP